MNDQKPHDLVWKVVLNKSWTLGERGEFGESNCEGCSQNVIIYFYGKYKREGDEPMVLYCEGDNCSPDEIMMLLC